MVIWNLKFFKKKVFFNSIINQLMLKIASLKMQNILKDRIPKIIPLRINLAVSTRYREIKFKIVLVSTVSQRFFQTHTKYL